MIRCEATMIIDSNIGQRIRYIRELNHLTREDLAEYADISEKFLYNIEYGRTGLSAKNLLKICQALEVSCDYIMTGRDEGTYDEELKNILESFNIEHIAIVKKILSAVLEISKF